MGVVDLGKIRGTMWYAGKAITGTSSAPVIFENSGISYAYADDLYANTENGNLYVCIAPGAEDTATWSYIGCIVGPQPGISNTLSSTSSVIALSANMGRKLNDKINNAGLYPFTVLPDVTKKTYLLRLEVENKESTIIITDEDGQEGIYEVAALDFGEKQTVSIPINNVIGFPEFGAIIKKIYSNNAAIYSYTMYDENTKELDSVNLNLWQTILDQNIDRKGAFVEGDNLYYTAQIQKRIDGETKELYPVSHDSAIWHNKAEGELVHTKIESMVNKDSALEEEIDALDVRLTAAEGDIDDLQEEMDGVPEQIQTIRNELNLLKGKIIDTAEEIQEVTEEGYITGALAAKNSLKIRLSEDLEFVQLWNGTEWVNWKNSGLLFDGYFIKNGTVNSVKIPNGFSNGINLTNNQGFIAGSSSVDVITHNLDGIYLDGFETLGMNISYSASGYSPSGGPTAPEVSSSGYITITCNLIDMDSGEILHTERLVQEGGSGITSTASYSPWGNGISKNKTFTMDVSSYAGKKIRVQYVLNRTTTCIYTASLNCKINSLYGE